MAPRAPAATPLIYAEQVALLYRQAPLVYGVTLLNGAILVGVQRAHIAIGVLLTWFASLLLVTVSRAGLSYQVAQSPVTPANASYWGRRYLMGVGAAGAVWGATAGCLFPVDAIGHQVFIAFVLAGMAAGGVAVLSARLEASVVFLLPTLLPLAIRFLLQEDRLRVAMGFMTLLFLSGMLRIAWTMHQALLTALTLRFDQRELIAEIAKRQQVEARLFQETERLQIILASLGEGVVITTTQATIEYLNPMAERLSGWSRAEATGRPLKDVFPSRHEQADRLLPTAVELCLQRAALCQQPTALVTRAGRRYLVHEIATPLRDRAGELSGAVAIYQDVTAARTRTAQLAYQAHHDGLTQLPNRHLLTDRLRHALAHAQRTQQRLAVLFVDIDHFKTINDHVGHAAGDGVLKTVAQRLQTCVRKTDTVARLGGDEFVIILEALAHEAAAEGVSHKVLTALAAPVRVNGREVVVTVSIGIALFPRDGADSDTLLKHADTAMYRAKQAGRNTAIRFARG